MTKFRNRIGDYQLPDFNIYEQFNNLQFFNFYDKYSRFNWLTLERESWSQTIERVTNLLRYLSDDRLPLHTYQKMFEMMYMGYVTPSMRLLATSEEQLKKSNLILYNCSYLVINSIESIKETLTLNLAGVGVGYSVENQFISQLPAVKQHIEDNSYFNYWTIPDTSEGWVDSVDLLLKALFNGKDIVFDYSLIRAEGLPLKTKGGYASGPKPLIDVHNGLRNIIKRNQGTKLKPIDVYDIVTTIGDAGLSGGVRRSAQICLFDENDYDMLSAKSGEYYKTHPNRMNSNNSVVLTKSKYTKQQLDNLLNEMWITGSGEPGIFHRLNAIETSPQRRNFIGYENSVGCNPCLTGNTLVAVADGREMVDIKTLANEGKDVPVYALDDNGKLVVRVMRNPRITGYNQPIYKVSFDNGDSITVTKNHKFLLHSGEYKEAINLIPGDSLYTMTRTHETFASALKKPSQNSQNYSWLYTNDKLPKVEHRLIAAHYNNVDILNWEYQVHHIDYNALNNISSNLQIMTKEDHINLHRLNKIGDKNPMVRAKNGEFGEEKYVKWRNNLSIAGSGENNPKYSGISNEDLKQHALILTKQVGRRFSQNEWQLYAKENNLPLSFSKWRKQTLGSIQTLSKWAANELKFDYTYADTRTLTVYNRLLSEGYDCFVDNHTVFVNKNCEKCNNVFVVHFSNREMCVCSVCAENYKKEKQNKQIKPKHVKVLCKKVNQDKSFVDFSTSAKQSWQQNREKYLLGMKITHENKKELRRKQQLSIYTELRFELGRNPEKREWVNACKINNVSSEISRVSSPFRKYKDLEAAANMYNHRVVSVEFIGYEDVYNGTVDDYHNFFVGGWYHKNSETNVDSWSFLCNQNCGEIILKANPNSTGGQLCNLTSIIARKYDTLEDIIERAEIATLIGDIQSLGTYFPDLSVGWKKITEEDRLLGVNLLGYADRGIITQPHILRQIKQHCIDTDLKFARLFDVNQSAAITALKPSGNSSLLYNTPPGGNPYHFDYQYRNVTVMKNTTMYHFLYGNGVPYQEYVGKPNAVMFKFPLKSPDNVSTLHNTTALQQLEAWKNLKLNFTEHNPSISITYQPNEIELCKQWLYNNQNIIGGLSFFPMYDASHPMFPIQQIDELEYTKAVNEFPKLNWSNFNLYETHTDERTIVGECVGGQCAI